MHAYKPESWALFFVFSLKKYIFHSPYRIGRMKRRRSWYAFVQVSRSVYRNNTCNISTETKEMWRQCLLL